MHKPTTSIVACVRGSGRDHCAFVIDTRGSGIESVLAIYKRWLRRRRGPDTSASPLHIVEHSFEHYANLLVYYAFVRYRRCIPRYWRKHRIAILRTFLTLSCQLEFVRQLVSTTTPLPLACLHPNGADMSVNSLKTRQIKFSRSCGIPTALLYSLRSRRTPSTTMYTSSRVTSTMLPLSR